MSGSGRPSRAAACRMPASGRAQVALDVDGQRLERADVEHPAAAQRVVGDGRGGQPVEGGQERGERLARAGRARRPGCARRRRRPPTRRPGPRSAPRRRRRARPGWRGRTSRHPASLPAGYDRQLLARALARRVRVGRRLAERLLQRAQPVAQGLAVRAEVLLRTRRAGRPARRSAAGPGRCRCPVPRRGRGRASRPRRSSAPPRRG